MFSINRTAPNRLDIEISGKITGEEMERALPVLFEHASDISNGQMLYRIRDLSLPTFSAIAVELGQLPQLFRLVKHFERVAVLADEGWIRKAGELEGKLFPGVEIRAFNYDEVEAAETWLAQ